MKTDAHVILRAMAVILVVVLVVPWACHMTEGQTGLIDITFTQNDVFEISMNDSTCTISFAANGTYAQVSMENGLWKFVNLNFTNTTQETKLNLTVSVQDSNITITSYRMTNPSNTLGSVRIRYVVEGKGKQTFNFGMIPKDGYWNVIFQGVYKSPHDGWDISPDGTLIVTGAASGIDVNIVYYTLPDSFGEAKSQPIYVQHSVLLATGVGMLVIVALCLAIWRRNRRHDTNPSF